MTEMFSNAEPDVTALVDALRGRRVVVLAGAGCSTESGIPDYRGGSGRKQGRPPIQYQEFVRSAEGRARYWARSTVGWPRFSAARPNAGHRALARLETAGVACGLITQNVDGLHQAAGSLAVVELHGALSFVRCLDCGARFSRDEVQRRILSLNRDWAESAGLDSGGMTVVSAPDGDAELPAERVAHFRVPDCATCGGVLKPDVVLFGENVPADRVQAAWRLFEAADVLLVVGSSLTVYSGRRFVHRAAQAGTPVAIVNEGPTRADDVACVKVEGRLGNVLPRVADALILPTVAAATRGAGVITIA
jgi:NAD-dependent SIR2 family protein deacetylase